jgi:hypothetical protein
LRIDRPILCGFAKNEWEIAKVRYSHYMNNSGTKKILSGPQRLQIYQVFTPAPLFFDRFEHRTID